jgi:hypothetical protein
MIFQPIRAVQDKNSSVPCPGKNQEGTKYLEPSLNDAFEDLNGGQGEIFSTGDQCTNRHKTF